MAVLMPAAMIDIPGYWRTNYGNHPSLGDLVFALEGSV